MSNGQTGFYGTKPLCSCLVGESQSVGVTQDRQRERENCDAQCPGNPACLEGRGWSASRSRSDGMSLWDSLARASSARQRAAPGAVPGPSLYEIRSGAQKSEQWRHRRPAATEILSLRPRTAVATAGTTSGPPRHFFLSFLGFSIVTNYRTYTLYLLSTTKATTKRVKRCEDMPQRFSFPPNAELAIRPSPPILMRWPWVRPGVKPSPQASTDGLDLLPVLAVQC